MTRTRRRNTCWALGFSLAVTACGDADNRGESLSTLLAGLCESVGGGGAQLTSSSEGCSSLDNLPAALDMDYGSFARLGPGANCRPVFSSNVVTGRAQSGVVFPEGRSAGALIRPPIFGAGSDTFQMTVRTYLGGAVQDSAVAVFNQGQGGTSIVGIDPAGRVQGALGPRATRGLDGYFGIDTTRPYDTVELQFDQSRLCGGPECEVRIYEICTR